PIPAVGPYDYRSVTYANGLFVTVGFYRPESEFSTAPSYGLIRFSPDGFSGGTISSPAYPILNGVTHNQASIVAVGYSHSGGVAFTSVDGSNWTKSSTGRDVFAVNGVTWGRGMFVAVGYPGAILTSTNG